MKIKKLLVLEADLSFLIKKKRVLQIENKSHNVLKNAFVAKSLSHFVI